MPLNEDGMPPRQCFVIRVETEEEVGNARAVLMEAMLVCDEKPIIYHLEICMLRLRLFESGFQNMSCKELQPLLPSFAFSTEQAVAQRSTHFSVSFSLAKGPLPCQSYRRETGIRAF